MSAIDKLLAQQAKVKARSPQWMVAEQLMDICRHEPACEALLDKDLDVAEMSITEAEKKIKAFADSHKSGGFACVTPAESDNILREFYGLPKNSGTVLRQTGREMPGLPKPGEAATQAAAEPAAAEPASPLGGLSLEDFL